MDAEISLKAMQEMWHGNVKSYAIGFGVSFLLTALSFTLVAYEVLKPPALVYTISALALVQASVQLRYFLHLGQEGKPHWETVTFFFMLLILLIIALGSLWIMFDLNERMMPHNHENAAHD